MGNGRAEATLEIESVVRDCILGKARGDRDRITRAFLLKGFSVGHFDGILDRASVDEFINACLAERIPETEPVPDCEFEDIRV